MTRLRWASWRVGYVNAHGTATLANDAAESRAIQEVFNGRALPVSSTKPVTGHLLGAAGALETIVAALAIFHQTVPLTLNFVSPAAGCELDYVRGASRSAPLRSADDRAQPELRLWGHQFVPDVGRYLTDR